MDMDARASNHKPRFMLAPASQIEGSPRLYHSSFSGSDTIVAPERESPSRSEGSVQSFGPVGFPNSGTEMLPLGTESECCSWSLFRNPESV